jgi:hypothetical protein
VSLTSTDPFEVLGAIRAVAKSRKVSNRDFVSPSGKDERALELPEPGVIHPAHVAWVAQCLGRTPESVERVLLEPSPDDHLAALARALFKAAPTPLLRKLKVEPAELLIRRLPVPPGNQRPNRDVLTHQNASWQHLFRSAQSVTKMVALGVPEIILDGRAYELQRGFSRLLHLLRGLGPELVPRHLPNTDPPTSKELVVLPRRSSAGLGVPPTTPFEVRVVDDLALVRFPTALAQIDLSDGRFWVQPFADAGFARIDQREAVFCDGLRLHVLDLKRREFTVEPEALPLRVILGACCGVEILDTEKRMTALLPGPLASSGFDFAVSPCGRYGWLDMVPRADEVGVFSIERLERVFKVWPHPTLGTPAGGKNFGEGHDGTPRALARFGESFRVAYGRHVISGKRAHELPETPRAMSFDTTATRLATADEKHLTLYALSSTGAPKPSVRWSLAPLHAHLRMDAFDLTGLGADAVALSNAVGTVATLAALTPRLLGERLYSEPTPEALKRIVSHAKHLKLATHLTRA